MSRLARGSNPPINTVTFVHSLDERQARGVSFVCTETGGAGTFYPEDVTCPACQMVLAQRESSPIQLEGSQ